VKYLTILLFSLVLGSCQKPIEGEPRVIVNNSIATDFKVPTAIFDEIKKQLGPDMKSEPEYIFTDIEVEIKSDQKFVLSQPRYLFKFPNGGGELDLKNYVTGEGSFYLHFPAKQFESKPPLEFLFYLSDAPKKKIRDNEFGLGCGQWVDLKPKFESLQKPDFLKLNTVEQTYVHVLSGQYIFVFKKGIQYQIAHLNIYDSRYRDQMCTALFNVK
jgi:hypothetical protein